jgi:hypothetical protein
MGKEYIICTYKFFSFLPKKEKEITVFLSRFLKTEKQYNIAIPKC